MSMRSYKSLALKKRIAVILLLIFLFLAAANLATWKANITSPSNVQNSVLGRLAQEALAAGDNSTADLGLTLSEADLVDRTIIPPIEHATLLLPAASNTAIVGSIDEIRRTDKGWAVRGWSFPTDPGERPEFLIASQSGKVIGALRFNQKRPDVVKALGRQDALLSGFSGQITTATKPADCSITLSTLSSSLKLYPMPDACEKAAHPIP
ncbi:hypothetical protein [Pseudomonas petrae]|uniref:Uncharacterized protein n=1 Tax=Pseudomonas petrae TaxID=2912190 RepID=A0ABS9IDB2_9PSED|nr:hypothetical protein [Pseudomonas petrae]MCF7534699.1 hypothetical protein [Pseudomonas petrae]MCF7539109.1 hypothetical protein [Pseudomonas petrae]MCF7545384.1 hypothetical protein [Pseudomonas petrae]MCF7557865.1 hypothetical protein [Pseudomonas petrae]